MMNSANKFYQHCYQGTGGWVPMMPLGSKLHLGDFGQIHDSRFLALGNIFELKNFPKSAPERAPIETSDEFELNWHDWQMSDGIEVETSDTQQANSELDGEDSSSELLRERSTWFSEKGSFSFNCNTPKAQFILNWSQINQIIMLGLTLIEHSFREVYVVTRVATVDHWELAIARAANAELKVASRTREEDHGHFTYDASAVRQQSKGLDAFDRGVNRPAHFFQAKKLILSNVKRDHYINEIVKQKPKPAPHIIANLLKTDLLNQVKENELNQPHFSKDDACTKKDGSVEQIEPCCKLNIAPYFEFFDWADISLDDVVKLG